MSLKMVFLLAGAAGLVGIGIGYFLRWIISLGKKGSVELEIKQLVLEAREEAKKITDDAKTKAEETLISGRVELKEKEDKLKTVEDRLIKKEDFLDKRQVDIDKEVEEIKAKVAEVKKIKEKVETMETQKHADLEKIAKLSETEAKQFLLAAVEKKSEEDITVRMRKLETVNQEKLEKRAQEIITAAIQRFGNSVTSDVFTTAVAIPSDEIKGKIIGKEGRNIKAFERVSGVEVIVDDTPGAITLSSFDPVRRQVARVALENLILDGRIQPAKIEKEMERLVKMDLPMKQEYISVEKARKIFKDKLNLFDDQYDALKDCDGLCILTEWNQFIEGDFNKIKQNLKKPIIFDGRNIFNPEKIKQLGFKYYSVGR